MTTTRGSWEEPPCTPTSRRPQISALPHSRPAQALLPSFCSTSCLCSRVMTCSKLRLAGGEGARSRRVLLLLVMIIILLFFPLLASLSSSSQIKKRGFESRILKACLLDTGPRIGLLRGQSSACPQSADMDAHLHTFLRRNTGGDITTATPSLPEASANRGVSVGLLPSSRYCSREFSSSAVCSRIPGFVVLGCGCGCGCCFCAVPV